MIIKYINRILYAALAALGLMTVVLFADTIVRSNETYTLAHEAFENQQYEMFLPVRYYHQDLVHDFLHVEADRTLHIKVYELIEQNGNILVEGFTIIILQTDGEALPHDFTAILQLANEDTLTAAGYQASGLPMYLVFVPSATTTFITRDLLTIDGIYRTLVSMDISLNDNTKISISLSVDINDFRLKNLVEHLETLPTESTGSIGVTPTVIINTTSAILISTLIYIGIVAGITILIFKRRNKKMGKAQATIHLQKDIEKLHQSNKNE